MPDFFTPPASQDDSASPVSQQAKPDLSKIPTEQLQQMLQQAQPTVNTKPDLSKIPTEQLQQMLQTASAPPNAATGGALGTLNAVASQGATGFLEGAQSVGHLADTILRNTVGKVVPNVVNKYAGKAADLINSTVEGAKGYINDPSAQADIAANPVSSSLAGGAMNIGGQTAMMGAALNPVNKIAQPIAESIPAIGKNPVLTGAISQGTLGAGIGAAQNPEHPITGAVVGGLTGAVFGGLSGAAGEAIQRNGRIVQETTKDLIDSGRNPYDMDSVRVLQAALKDEGVDIRTYDAKQELKAEVDRQLSAIRPDNFEPGTSPIKLIGDKIQSNYPEVMAQNKANYDPIDTSEAPVNVENYNKVLDNVKDSLSKLDLPMRPLRDPETGEVTGKISALPEDANINQALQYRRQLDSTIKQAQALAANGKISQDDVLPYYQLRSALNQDIHTAASQVPFNNPSTPEVKTLEDQLNLAEKYNQTNVQPFKVIDKNYNVIDNPKAENRIWNNISSELQARRPNFDNIRRNAALLGPDGKELMGWGLIENAFNRGTSVSGEFNPNIIQSQLTRMKATGLLDEVATDEQKDVAAGISDAITAASKAKVKGADPGWIASKIQMLTHSRAGISFLRTVGNTKTGSDSAGKMIQQLITGLVAQKAGSMSQNR